MKKENVQLLIHQSVGFDREICHHWYMVGVRGKISTIQIT